MWEIIEPKYWDETLLREFIKMIYFPEMVMYDKMSRVDDHTDRLEIEFKCRKENWNEPMIEEEKYNALIDRAKLNKRIPVYICSFPSGVKMFIVDEIDIKFECVQDMPRTTQFDNKERITKRVGYLKLDDGITLLTVDHMLYENGRVLELDEWM